MKHTLNRNGKSVSVPQLPPLGGPQSSGAFLNRGASSNALSKTAGPFPPTNGATGKSSGRHAQTARVAEQYGHMFRPPPEYTDPPESEEIRERERLEEEHEAWLRTQNEGATTDGKGGKLFVSTSAQQQHLSTLQGDETVTSWPSSKKGMKPQLLTHLELYIRDQLTLMHHVQGQDRETMAIYRGDLVRHCLEVFRKHFKLYRSVFDSMVDCFDGVVGLFDTHREEMLRLNQRLQDKDDEIVKLKESFAEERLETEAKIKELTSVSKNYHEIEEDRKVARSLCEEFQRRLTKQKGVLDATNDRVEKLSRQHVTMTMKDDRNRQKLEQLEKELTAFTAHNDELKKTTTDQRMKIELLEVAVFRAEKQRDKAEDSQARSTDLMHQLQEDVRMLRLEKRNWIASTHGGALQSVGDDGTDPSSGSGTNAAVLKAIQHRQSVGNRAIEVLTPRPDWRRAEEEEQSLTTLTDTSSAARVKQLVEALAKVKERCSELEKANEDFKERIEIIEAVDSYEGKRSASGSQDAAGNDPFSNGFGGDGQVNKGQGKGEASSQEPTPPQTANSGPSVSLPASPRALKGKGNTVSALEKLKTVALAGGVFSALSQSSISAPTQLVDKVFVPCGSTTDIPSFLRVPMEHNNIPVQQLPLRALLELLEDLYLFVGMRYEATRRTDALPPLTSAPITSLDSLEAFYAVKFEDEIAAWLEEKFPAAVPPGVQPPGVGEGLMMIPTTTSDGAGEGDDGITEDQPHQLGREKSTGSFRSVIAATLTSSDFTGTVAPSATSVATGGGSERLTKRQQAQKEQQAELVVNNYAAAVEKRISLGYSIVYVAQHAHYNHPLCRMFLYQLSGEIPKDTGVFFLKEVQTIRRVFEDCDPSGSGSAPMEEVLEALIKAAPHYSPHERKILEEVSTRSSIPNVTSLFSKRSALDELGYIGAEGTAGAPVDTEGKAALLPSNPSGQQLVHYPTLLAAGHPFTAAIGSCFLCSVVHNIRSHQTAIKDAPFGGDHIPIQIVQNALHLGDPHAPIDIFRAYIAKAMCVPANVLTNRSTVSRTFLTKQLHVVYLQRRTAINAGIIKFSQLEPPMVLEVQVQASLRAGVETGSNGTTPKADAGKKAGKKTKVVRAAGRR